MSKLVEGRVAIVTGAGRGIGREHALMLAEHGAKVIVNDLGGEQDGTGADTGPAGEVVAEIEAMGGEAATNGADISDYEQAGAMIAQAIETFGKLDILINNAGILRDRMIFSMSESDWDAVIKVHLKGTYAPTHHAARYWREQAKEGHEVDARVVNTSSPSGIYGNVGQANYGAAKAGIAAFTVITAMELVKYGVTVNCIAPGALTRMTESIIGHDESLAQSWSPRRIAPIVTWLCSPEAKNVTGRVFDVKGEHLGIAEGWHLGPDVENVDDPTEVGPLVTKLMADARLNAGMDGNDTEGPGRPGQSI